MNDLYAVIEGRPIVWSVIDFTGGGPRLVPIGRWVRQFEGVDPRWQAVPVTSGEVWAPNRGETVMYAPTVADLMEAILPWIETEERG
jgi:hypothetical protein